MKFIVDQLPYYEDNCPLGPFCCDVDDPLDCPRKWSKYKVCSDENPHECNYLIEQEENS